MKQAYRILEPRVGMVIVEDDPRSPTPRRIVGTDPGQVYTQSGSDGQGRRSTISRRRLAQGRYKLLKDAP